MCLLLASRAHPSYELVLISNRDEFFGRKAGATCWNYDDYILCPYDVPLSVDSYNFGTWCGINKAGNVGTILNLKLDDNSGCKREPVLSSRGKVPTAYLSRCSSNFEDWDSYDKFAEHYSELDITGDFNFFYGDCKKSEYRIIDSLANTFNVLRSSDPESADSYLVVSNDSFQPKTYEWKKIQLARKLLRNLIKENGRLDQEAFISKCFQVASTRPDNDDSEVHPTKSEAITRQAIFVPPLKVPPDLNPETATPAGFYGTRSQIVLLVSKDHRKVTFVERVIHNSEDDIEIEQMSPDRPAQQVKFEFDLV